MTTREGVYIAGDYYVLCDTCGFKKRRSECSLDWEKKLVCTATCLDVRNPQDFVRSRPERQNVVDARYAAPVFVDVGGAFLMDEEEGLLLTDESTVLLTETSD